MLFTRMLKTRINSKLQIIDFECVVFPFCLHNIQKERQYQLRTQCMRHTRYNIIFKGTTKNGLRSLSSYARVHTFIYIFVAHLT